MVERNRTTLTPDDKAPLTWGGVVVYDFNSGNSGWGYDQDASAIGIEQTHPPAEWELRYADVLVHRDLPPESRSRLIFDSKQTHTLPQGGESIKCVWVSWITMMHYIKQTKK